MLSASVRMSLVVFSLVALVNGAQAQTNGTPTNPALRQELLSRLKNDQDVRQELISKGADHPDPAVLAKMKTTDTENTARVKAIIQQFGWPGPGLVGQDGTEAAFLIVQHADHVFQKEMLPLVEKAYRANQLPGDKYAMLLDRVRVGDGKPQVYGTQAKPIDQWTAREPVMYPIEDEANVEKRRAEVGLPPLAEYVKLLKQFYFPDNKQK